MTRSAASAAPARPASGRPPAGRSRPGWQAIHGRRTAIWFLAPALAILTTLILYPIGHTVWLSFHSADGSRFVGLDNYVEMFSSPGTRRAIANNAIWLVAAPSVVTALGLLFAVLTERVRLAHAFRLVLFMPMAISFLAAGVTFRLVYDEDPNRGLLNAALVTVHDTFAPPAPYPGATFREGAGLASADGAIATGPVQTGTPVLVPLVGLAAAQVPDSAAPASLPTSGPGLRGTVWRDFTPGGGGASGVIDPGEPGLPGMTVQAVRDGATVAQTSTDRSGQFVFQELAGGGYTVRLAAGNFTEPFRGLTWLGPGLVTPALIGSYVWVWAGFAMVVISAGFASIPRSAVESAKVDGASDWQITRLVTIPLLRPVLAVVVITLAINVLKIFDLVIVLPPESVRPDANVIGLAQYHASFTQLNSGLGAALALFLFTLVLPGMAWRAWVLRRQERR